MGRKFDEVFDEQKRVPYKIVKAANGDARCDSVEIRHRPTAARVAVFSQTATEPLPTADGPATLVFHNRAIPDVPELSDPAAIHPVATFPDRRSGVGAVKLAFTVFDVDALARRLEASGVALLYPPRDTGFFRSTAILDPDGNLIEFTQLCDAWFEELDARHARGVDVVTRWRAAKR